MKTVQSFQYRGIPVVIQVNSNSALINTGSQIKSYTCTDVNLLRRAAETLVDQEIDGVLSNSSNRLRDNVSDKVFCRSTKSGRWSCRST